MRRRSSLARVSCRFLLRSVRRVSAIRRQTEFFCQADIGIGALGRAVNSIHRIALPYQAIRDRVQERFADRVAHRFGARRSRERKRYPLADHRHMSEPVDLQCSLFKPMKIAGNQRGVPIRATAVWSRDEYQLRCHGTFLSMTAFKAANCSSMMVFASTIS